MTEQEQAELTALRKLEAEVRDMRGKMTQSDFLLDYQFRVSEEYVFAVDDALALVDGIRSENGD